MDTKQGILLYLLLKIGIGIKEKNYKRM